MKITNLTVRSAMKLSRNYNTVDADISLSVELSEDDNVDEVHEQLVAMAHDMVTDDIRTSIDLLDRV